MAARERGRREPRSRAEERRRSAARVLRRPRLSCGPDRPRCFAVASLGDLPEPFRVRGESVERQRAGIEGELDVLAERVEDELPHAAAIQSIECGRDASYALVLGDRSNLGMVRGDRRERVAQDRLDRLAGRQRNIDHRVGAREERGVDAGREVRGRDREEAGALNREAVQGRTRRRS
jgi:hypothetical protein